MVKYILMLNVNAWTVQEFRELHITAKTTEVYLN